MSNLPQKTTVKKVKYKGTMTFIEAATGEIKEFCVTDIEERDFNFTKVWMRNFVNQLEIIGNKKTKICFWIIDHLNKENEIAMNYRQIAEETGTSLQTVAFTMKELQNSDFLRKVGTAYRVNPDILFKGTRGARMGLLNEYRDAPKEEMTADQKIKNIEQSIALLQQQKDSILKDQGVIDLEVDDQLSFNKKGEIVETAKPTKRSKKP